MAELLSDNSREDALAGLPEWHYVPEEHAITRSFSFRDFSEAFGFMARVALVAEAAGHHPDWFNSYNRVTIALSTHSAGGVTDNDLKLAAAIDALVG
jgi:4a-hydroxytetrahydrobiopterin dehydratase